MEQEFLEDTSMIMLTTIFIFVLKWMADTLLGHNTANVPRRVVAE